MRLIQKSLFLAVLVGTTVFAQACAYDEANESIGEENIIEDGETMQPTYFPGGGDPNPYWCHNICSFSSSCSRPCDEYPVGLSTCGQYGVCCEPDSYFTTTSSTTVCASKCTGYNLIGQQVTCQISQNCTKKTTWLRHMNCTTGSVTNVKVSETITGCGTLYDNCNGVLNPKCGPC